jgi:arsenate reductase (thioredoxin)
MLLKNMKNILILCTGNSCRSQIAHGYFEHFTDGRSVNVYSAGVETHGVNPRAVAVMKADGIDISHHTSNNMDEYRDIDFDYVITVCDNARERCPWFPGKAQKFHHNFPDPAKATGTEAEVMEQFRTVREMIKDYVQAFVKKQHLNE